MFPSLRKNEIPFRAMILLVLGWVVMILINYLVNEKVAFTGTRITFPISVVYFSRFNLQGILFAFCFLAFGLFALKFYERLRFIQVFFVFASLLVLGNLSQGSLEYSFLRGLITKTDVVQQYYHDALRIENSKKWLGDFNEIQGSLTMHARTHPPFAVLLEYFILRLFNYSTFALGACYSLLGILCFFPMKGMMNELVNEKSKQNLLVILFAVLPAVNIYSIASLDGVILTFSSLFLYGLIRCIKRNYWDWWGFFALVSGFIVVNLLSFGGSFLAAVLVICSVFGYFKLKNKWVFISGILVAICFSFILFLLYAGFDYNHISSFFTASNLENPRGFRGFQEPVVYVFTRIECVSETFLFLSFGFWAYLFYPGKLNNEYSFRNNDNFYSFLIPFIALSIYGLMLITGAYGTGETARACLFLYPYFMLFLIKTDWRVIWVIAFLALIQTFFMQLTGDYFF